MPLDSGGDTLQVGGLCGVPGRGTQESGEGPGAAWDGESSPESSTFSGDEEEKGEGLEVKPRLLEPVKSSWSKADSRVGPKRFLETCSSDCSFSAQLGTRIGQAGCVLFLPRFLPSTSGPWHTLFLVLSSVPRKSPYGHVLLLFRSQLQALPTSATPPPRPHLKSLTPIFHRGPCFHFFTALRSIKYALIYLLFNKSEPLECDSEKEDLSRSFIFGTQNRKSTHKALNKCSSNE